LNPKPDPQPQNPNLKHQTRIPYAPNSTGVGGAAYGYNTHDDGRLTSGELLPDLASLLEAPTPQTQHSKPHTLHRRPYPRSLKSETLILFPLP